MKVLGIDPGYGRLGIAVVEKQKGKDRLLFSECFETESSETMPERLFRIGERIRNVIEEYRPNTLAIERLFFNSNQKTAMHVSEARGVILYEATRQNLLIKEFTPLEVKTAIVSYGRADKKQMIAMIPKLIEVKKTIEHDDEYDAIGIAITCLAHH